MRSIDITNKMIRVYKNTPVEDYPETRAIQVLDNYSFNDPDRYTAFKLFMEWREFNKWRV